MRPRRALPLLGLAFLLAPALAGPAAATLHAGVPPAVQAPRADPCLPPCAPGFACTMAWPTCLPPLDCSREGELVLGPLDHVPCTQVRLAPFVCGVADWAVGDVSACATAERFLEAAGGAMACELGPLGPWRVPCLRDAEASMLPALARAMHDDPGSVLLAGTGTATTVRGGVTTACPGDPQMAIEASRKPLGLEPTVSMAYALGGGSTGCAMGRFHQPDSAGIAGDLDGAWSVDRCILSSCYRLDVGAPRGDGTRHVRFLEVSADGDRDGFEGDLAELR